MFVMKVVQQAIRQFFFKKKIIKNFELTNINNYFIINILCDYPA